MNIGDTCLIILGLITTPCVSMSHLGDKVATSVQLIENMDCCHMKIQLLFFCCGKGTTHVGTSVWGIVRIGTAYTLNSLIFGLELIRVHLLDVLSEIPDKYIFL